ncbi:MAG: MATE family efflux transporter, partial [Lachnospiraceae bacterium]
TVLIARYLGEKRPQEIGAVIGGATLVFAGISVVLFILMVGFAHPISVLMQAPEEAVDLTTMYVRICGGGIFFIVAYNVLSAIFRGLGDSKSPLLFVLIACIINIIGDLVLVAGFHLDAAGAAAATVLAQACSVVFAIGILVKKHLPFTIARNDFKWNAQCGKFLRIGLPLAFQEVLTQLSFLALCAFVNRLGLEASSGYGVACKIVNFAMLVPSALMQSLASFVSQNVGAGKEKRARQTMFTGIGVGLVVGCFVFCFVMFRGDLLAGIFTTDAAVIQRGYEYLKGFAPETIMTAFLFSMIGYFNGNNRTVWVMTQGMIQTLLIRLPFAYVMSIQPDASLTMIGLAAPVSTTVGVVMCAVYYWHMNRKKA